MRVLPPRAGFSPLCSADTRAEALHAPTDAAVLKKFTPDYDWTNRIRRVIITYVDFVILGLGPCYSLTAPVHCRPPG